MSDMTITPTPEQEQRAKWDLLLRVTRKEKLQAALAATSKGDFSRQRRLWALVQKLKDREDDLEFERNFDEEWEKREHERTRRIPRLVFSRPVPEKPMPFKRFSRKPFCG